MRICDSLVCYSVHMPGLFMMHKHLYIPFCLLMTACSWQGIPLPAQQPTPSSDMDMLPDIITDDMGQTLAQCTPQEARCIGDNVQLCNDTGTNYTITPCPLQTQCEQGECVQNSTGCIPGEDVALSHQNIFFQVSPDGKTSSETLVLTNCSAAPMLIQKATIFGASTPDRTQQVFELSPESASAQGTTLPPGESFPIKIEFRPRSTQGYESGSFYLSMVGDTDIINHEIPLHTNTWCLGTPPLLDLGDIPLQELTSVEIPIHNCGTRALVLSGSALSVVQGQEDAMSSIHVLGTEKPSLIAPGETLPITLELTPELKHTINAELNLIFAPRDQSKLLESTTTIPIIGRAISLPSQVCSTDVDTTIFIDELPSAQTTLLPLLPYQLSLGSLDEEKFIINPQDTVRFEASSTLPSRVEPFLTSIETLFGPSALLIPYSSGTHQIQATRFVTEDDTTSCEVTQIQSRVTGYGEYTFELQWSAPDDPIPSDGLPNQGVDLDLYVRTIADPLNPTESWLDPHTSCASTRAPERCANDQGYAFQQSITGATPEFITLYPNDSTAQVEVGVLVKNLASFESVCATLRIWRGDTLIAQSPPEEFAQPACGSPAGYLMLQNNNFWIPGVLDLQNEAMDMTQERLLSRGIPNIPN